MKKNRISVFDIIIFLLSIALITFSIYQFNIKQPYSFAVFLALLLGAGLLLVFDFINKDFGTIVSKPIILIANILIVLSFYFYFHTPGGDNISLEKQLKKSTVSLNKIISENKFLEAEKVIKNGACITKSFKNFDLSKYSDEQKKFILNHCYDYSGMTYLCCCLFYKAYDKNLYSVVDNIMKFGADPDFSCRKFCYGNDFTTEKFVKKDSYPYKPLQFISSYKGNLSNLSIELTKLMLSHGADINGNFYGYSPVMSAAASGNLELLKFLISKGVNVQQTGPDGDNILFPSMEKPYVNIVKYLLDNTSIDVNQKNNEGQSAVFELAEPINGIPKKEAELRKYEKSLLKTLNLLVKHGVNLNVIDKSGLSLLGAAVKAGNPYLTELLIKDKVKINPENKVKLFEFAVKTHNYPALNMLLSQDVFKGLDRKEYAETLFSIMKNVFSYKNSEADSSKIVRMMINNNIDFNIHETNVHLLILFPIKYGNCSVLKDLVKNGYNLNAVDSKGYTALDYAKFYKRARIAEYLEQNGAKTNKYSENSKGVE